MDFDVTIMPQGGLYGCASSDMLVCIPCYGQPEPAILCRGGAFLFTFHVTPAYPHDPPKVKCKTKVYHPNIDLEGNVCLNILREDWKPVLNINTIIYGLNHLFVVSRPISPGFTLYLVAFHSTRRQITTRTPSKLYADESRHCSMDEQ